MDGIFTLVSIILTVLIPYSLGFFIGRHGSRRRRLTDTYKAARQALIDHAIASKAGTEYVASMEDYLAGEGFLTSGEFKSTISARDPDTGEEASITTVSSARQPVPPTARKRGPWDKPPSRPER